MATYPVKWRTHDLAMGDLTVGMKKAFCAWLVHKLRADAIADLRGQTNVLNAYLDGVRARVWWVAGGASPAVVDALKSPDGGLYYTRLLFGDSAKALADDELRELMDEKEAEQVGADEVAAAAGHEPPYPPVNDYTLALDAVHEAANPKARGPATSGSATTGTPSTGPFGTSPSGPTPTPPTG